MDDAALAWVAGYLEGEGCFHLQQVDNQRFGLYRYPRVIAACTDLDVLQRLQRASGVGRIVGPTRRGTNSPMWRWTVSTTREAVELMEAIYPFMGQRRRARIDEILDAMGRTMSRRLGGRTLGGRTLDHHLWVVGFLEAEGSFYWMTFRKGKYGPYYYPRVAAGGTDRDVIELLPTYTGIGRITGPYPRKPPRKAAWYWTVTAREDAVAFMKSIHPHMGQRRQARISEVLVRCGPGALHAGSPATPAASRPAHRRRGLPAERSR
jgi:hypothetical protein